MHKQKNRYAFHTRLVLILLAGLFLLPAGVFAISVSLEPLSLMPGESGTTNLTLDSIPSGISGYRTGLRLTTSGIAEITGVRFPSWAGMNDQTGFPGPEVNIKAAALGEPVSTNTGITILATLTVKGITAGTTTLELYDLSIDDEQGDAVNASIENTLITVSSATALAESTSSGTGNNAGETNSGTEGQVTTPVSMVMTAIPTQVLTQARTTDLNQSPQTIPVSTKTSVIPLDQTPAATTPAQGVPFVSLAGIVGLLVTIVMFGNRVKKR
jgi:hypothetical protein